MKGLQWCPFKAITAWYNSFLKWNQLQNKMQNWPHTLAIFHLADKNYTKQMYNVAKLLGGWSKKV